MKKSIIYIYTGVLLAISTNTNATDYTYEPFTNTLPSEHSLQQIQEMTAKPKPKGWWDDGPPGSGTGGGGAVGVSIGNVSIFQLIVVIAICYGIRKSKLLKRKDESV